MGALESVAAETHRKFKREIDDEKGEESKEVICKEGRKEGEKVGMMLHLQLDVLNEGDRARWCIS